MEIAAKVTADYFCGDCLKKLPPFIQARSLFHYDDAVRTLISKLKYQKDTSVIRAIAELTGGLDRSCFAACDWIVPVPLHRKRLQQRGFNQALLLARAYFGKTDRRVAPSVLQRTINTVPQVSLDAKSRRNSLKNAFKVNPTVDISGSSICLIDDVYTTGTTVSECSKALLDGGAAEVSVLTFARVKVPHRGRR
jgi:ComF family protein